MQSIQITINYQEPRGILDRAVLHGVSHAAVGLSCLPLRDPLPALPVQIPITTDPEQGWTAEYVSKTYRRFIITGVLRDVIEASSAFLEEVYQILCVWELTGPEGAVVEIDGGALSRALRQRPAKFHKAGLPEKLTTLRAHGLGIPEHLVERLTSVNAARNCLVHRRGIVREPDLSPSSQVLAVRWERIEALVVGLDGVERPIALPMDVQAGEAVTLRTSPAGRDFRLGEAIDFEIQELSDICMSFMMLGQAVTEELVALGRSKGKIATSKSTE